jgi:hypothetical protein
MSFLASPPILLRQILQVYGAWDSSAVPVIVATVDRLAVNTDVPYLAPCYRPHCVLAASPLLREVILLAVAVLQKLEQRKATAREEGSSSALHPVEWLAWRAHETDGTP